MSKPRSKIYSRTMFVVEGLKEAILVTHLAGRMSQRTVQFETAEAALAWCRSHRAGLIYSPFQADPQTN